MTFEFDVFICHASEDKVDVVEPLAEELQKLGLKVWLDKSVIKIGDSLRRKIDEGLSKSRYGIVVLSPEFFKKNWPQYELDGLLAREMADAAKVILPVWHKVTAKEVKAASPSLSMLYAGNTQGGVPRLASDLADVIGVGGTSISVPEIEDDLALAKRVIMTRALQDNNRILAVDATLSAGKSINIKGYAFDDSEKQRKLFLHAIEQLVRAGLVEYISGVVYELTYPGIQAAERMDPFPDDKLSEIGN
ncbi:MAG: toll/interleukin-1 receptor domain-containing protein [Candidatus Melainabacteria bacterium]|nr:toll/interleukin-1 receptor domain-containing protein [Candidatus Melainabacteria bacterium]